MNFRPVYLKRLCHGIVVHVKEEVVECLKEEAEWKDSAADVASLYAGHEVKDELVLGPEGLQPRDIAFTLFAAQALAVTAQTKLKDCELQLECIDNLEAPLGTDTRRDTRVENKTDVGHEIHAPSAAGGRGEGRGRMSAGERRHCCQICNKKFTDSSNLKTHELIHSGERPYSCDICKMKFTRPYHLKKHELIHTGEKRYSCNICNKKFTRLDNLKEHERIHSGDKLFSCRTCNKKFTHHSSLRTHERIHFHHVRSIHAS